MTGPRAQGRSVDRVGPDAVSEDRPTCAGTIRWTSWGTSSRSRPAHVRRDDPGWLNRSSVATRTGPRAQGRSVADVDLGVVPGDRPTCAGTIPWLRAPRARCPGPAHVRRDDPSRGQPPHQPQEDRLTCAGTIPASTGRVTAHQGQAHVCRDDPPPESCWSLYRDDRPCPGATHSVVRWGQGVAMSWVAWERRYARISGRVKST